MPDPHPSTVLFPSQPESISQLLASLKRSTLSIHNRLTSIQADAEFVARVAAAYHRPMVANERCGSWYVPPAVKKGSAYFKSTDGHERAWKFSTRRLNLHLLEMIEENDGIIIVDSTRRGKRMPDALSTTIPIWCTVLNLTLLPSHPLSQTLHLPPTLPPSTHAQITALIPSFIASLQALNLSFPKLTKPLRPFWITPASPLPEDTIKQPIFDDYLPVICCTASRRVLADPGSEADARGYIQGAADDTENWAHGLTPLIFWAHSDALLAAPESDLPALITDLITNLVTSTPKEATSPVHVLTPSISVCALPLPDVQPSDQCHIALTSKVTPQETWCKSKSYMEVGLGKSKTASRNLRLALEAICGFVFEFFKAQGLAGRVLVACESGRDVSVGVALAILCYLFDDQGEIRFPGPDDYFTKTMVKSQLGLIMTVYPDANPSRTTLQSVNSFMMDWHPVKQ